MPRSTNGSAASCCGPRSNQSRAQCARHRANHVTDPRVALHRRVGAEVQHGIDPATKAVNGLTANHKRRAPLAIAASAKNCRSIGRRRPDGNGRWRVRFILRRTRARRTR